MVETPVSPYASLLTKARRAFGADPSYAIVMAQQAHIVRARRDRPSPVRPALPRL